MELNVDFAVLAKALVALFVLRTIIASTYRVLFHPLRKYPGPAFAKVSDFYGAYFAWNRKLHWKTYADHQKYGPIIRQGPNKLVFNSVTAINDIYRNERLPKSHVYLASQVKPGIFNLFNVLDKKLHRRKRRILGQGVNEKAMRSFEPVMIEQVQTYLNEIAKQTQQGKSIEMTAVMKHLSIDISMELGFGSNLKLQSEETNRWLVKGISNSVWRINLDMQYYKIQRFLGKALLIFFLSGLTKFYYLLQVMVAARLKEEKHARPDLFSNICDFVDPETGDKMGPQELWSESALFISAAGETTATAMTATVFYLSRYPAAYARLASEIRTTFSSADEIKAGPRLASCTYLRACIDEAMRISPPAGGTLWREVPVDAVTNPVIVDGIVLPPGTQVGVNTHTIHRNPAVFSDPLVFHPERWIDDESGIDEKTRKMMRDAFTPFSVGVRGCAGKAMAYLEASMVVARTLWYFDFKTPGGVKEGEDRVFHVQDQVGSWHEGPELVFMPRDGVADGLMAKAA